MNSPSVRQRPFGTLPDGKTVALVTLVAGDARVQLSSLGATLQAFSIPDRLGRCEDVTLGYDDLAGYVARPNYWGETIGRYANRIARARFRLDGRDYHLSPNDGAHSLHGGADGFDKKLWRVAAVEADPDRARAVFTLDSPSGDQGFPGRLSVTVAYSLHRNGELRIDFDATSDEPTIVSLTNHSVWHLGGPDALSGVDEHDLFVPATRFTPVGPDLIPTGELRAVEGSPLDFTSARALGPAMRAGHDEQIRFARGLDHNFALDKGETREPELAARLSHRGSGRILEVLSTAPGVQIYTGNFLDGTIAGKGGRLYRMGDGVAIEPQLFPDTPNQPAFGSARVEPDRPYRHSMIFRPLVET